MNSQGVPVRYGDYVTGIVRGKSDGAVEMVRQGYLIKYRGNDALVVGELDSYVCIPASLTRVFNVMPLSGLEYTMYTDRLIEV